MIIKLNAHKVVWVKLKLLRVGRNKHVKSDTDLTPCRRSDKGVDQGKAY